MLCYKDVDYIWDANGTDKIETKTAMNALLEKLGGDQFDIYYYWSSAENSDYENYAWSVGFNNASVLDDSKDSGTRVRAVCVF